MDEEALHHLSASDNEASGDASIDPNTPTAVFEPECGGSAVEAVVSIVAQEQGRDPLELPPLYRAVDPEALDELCAGGGESDVHVSFSYCDYRVLVESDGIVQLLDGSSDDD